MDIHNLKIVNGIKNEAFRNALISHGLGDQSKAKATLELLNRHPELMNSTEPRMTMYTSEINPYLYSDNSFMKRSVNDAAFAASGEQKMLNDSAAGPTVTKGRFYSQSLAHGDNAPTQTVKVRKNSTNLWEIEYFHTEPDALTRELTSEIPYDARGELLRAHADIINQSIGNFTAVEWAQGTVGETYEVDPSTGDSFFLFTSGTTTRTNLVVGSGTVKAIVKADMQNVKQALQKQQIVGKGAMFFLPTTEQYNDLLKIEDFVNFEKTGRESKLIKGEVGVLYGITILEPREREDWNANVVYSYTALGEGTTTDLTKIEDTADTGASMVSAGMAWVETQVLRAEGSAIVFPWLQSPIYLGDVYAVESRYGAKKKRGDLKGVVMLVENPFTT